MTKSPLPTPLVFTQNKKADRSGPGSLLTPSKTASPLVFFQLHWLEQEGDACVQAKTTVGGHLLAESHRNIFTVDSF